jgi:hypothetical protein
VVRVERHQLIRQNGGNGRGCITDNHHVCRNKFCLLNAHPKCRKARRHVVVCRRRIVEGYPATNLWAGQYAGPVSGADGSGPHSHPSRFENYSPKIISSKVHSKPTFQLNLLFVDVRLVVQSLTGGIGVCNLAGPMVRAGLFSSPQRLELIKFASFELVVPVTVSYECLCTCASRLFMRAMRPYG